MSLRKLLAAAVCSVAVLTVSAPAAARHLDTIDLARVVYGDASGREQGAFRRVAQGRWVEDGLQRMAVFSFVETGRSRDGVELVDPSRDVYIRLDLRDHRVYLRDGRNGRRKELYTIIAAERLPGTAQVNNVTFTDGNGVPLGRFVQQDRLRWVETGLDGNNVNFRFVERGRDASSIYLEDPTRDVELQLDLARMEVLHQRNNGRTKRLYLISEVGSAPPRKRVDPRPRPDRNDTPNLFGGLLQALSGVPGNLQPRSGSQFSGPYGGRWNFDWDEVPGSRRYQLQIAAPGSNRLLVDTEVNDHRYAFDPGPRPAPGTWEWRVRAADGGRWGDWSETATFNVQAASRFGGGTGASCTDYVQGRIAWNNAGDVRWQPAYLDALCADTRVPSEPGRCYERVMHGGVNWGGGTNWQPDNVLQLCGGSNDAALTVRCFENGISAGQNWQTAIARCGT